MKRNKIELSLTFYRLRTFSIQWRLHSNRGQNRTLFLKSISHSLNIKFDKILINLI
jgi:hypothetical protein